PRPAPASAASLFLRLLAPAPRLPGGPEEKEQDAEEDHGGLPQNRVRGIEERRPVMADPHERDDPHEVDDLYGGEPQQEADGPLPPAGGERQHGGSEEESRLDAVASILDIDREARRPDLGSGDRDGLPQRVQEG